MTEEEKRRRALEIFEQEKQRLSSRPLFNTHTTDTINYSLAMNERKLDVKRGLAQQGITWEQLRDAYNEEMARGQHDLLHYHLAFFYAGTAIVYQERFPESTPQGVADFMRALMLAPGDAKDRFALARKCREETGFDATVYDKDVKIASPTRSRAEMKIGQRVSKRDQAAINRMQETGITAADLEYERSVGYKDGRETPFFYSSCYAALGLALHSEKGFDVEQIESFIERVQEVGDEEISVADILERAEREAGVDVSEMADVRD